MQRNEEQVSRMMGVLLHSGVIMAASVVLAGGVWYLARFGMLIQNYRAFHGEPQELRSVAGILKGVAGLHPRSIIQLGLLLLIATPITRVAFSVLAFFARRDRTYVTITLVVLVVLLCSLAGLVQPPR
jgi:uncharacterized membrane protein